MSNSGDEVETRNAVNSWRRECALIMPQVDRMLSRLIAVAPKAALTGSESGACDFGVNKTRDAVLKSVEAVKEAKSCVDKALKFADLQIEEDTVALPNGVDGTLAEVVHGHTHRLPDSEVLSLYEKLKRRSMNLELAIEGGLPDPVQIGGVGDPLPDLEHADEARAPVTLLTNGDNFEPFDSIHVIDIPSSPEGDVEDVAAWEAHVTNNESSSEVLAKEVAAWKTHVAHNESSSEVLVKEVTNGENPVTIETSSPEGCAEEVTIVETPMTNKTSSPEACVEKVVFGETPMTKDASSPKVLRYNLRKRVSSARTSKENEGRRCAKRRKRRKWSEYEEETLKAGVQSVGPGSWKVIFSLYRDIFVNRTTVDLKDKWRGIERGK